MTRTDVHRPASPNFDPEAYEFRGVFDLRPEFTLAVKERARRPVTTTYRFKGRNVAHIDVRTEVDPRPWSLLVLDDNLERA